MMMGEVRVTIHGRPAVIFAGSKLTAIADGSVLVLPPGSAPSPTPLQQLTWHPVELAGLE
jgi:hypothetical protein